MGKIGGMSKRRHELSDEQWAHLVELLPPERPKTGRPAIEHRQVVNGILWVLRTGAPWRDLPERCGNWKTVYSRFRRWREAGVWEQVFAAVQQAADQRGEVGWEVHFVDGSIVRAHQHAAGAKKGRPSLRTVTWRIQHQTASAGGGEWQAPHVCLDGG